MMQSEALKTLTGLLIQETDIHRQVAGKMAEKRDILVQGEAKKLPGIDQELMALGQKIVHLETRRLELMQATGCENKTLQKIIEAVPAQEGAPLREARQALIQAVDEVKWLNDNNAVLIQTSMGCIRDTFQILGSLLAAPEGASYTAKGTKKGGNPANSSPDAPVQSTIIQSA